MSRYSVIATWIVTLKPLWLDAGRNRTGSSEPVSAMREIVSSVSISSFSPNQLVEFTGGSPIARSKVSRAVITVSTWTPPVAQRDSGRPSSRLQIQSMASKAVSRSFGLIRIVLDLVLRSWMKVAGGAGYTSRHRQPYHVGTIGQGTKYGLPCLLFSPGSVGPCRGEGRPGREGAQRAPDQGVPRRPSVWGRLWALNDRIENCWIGDLLACAALFVGLFALIIFMGVLL